MGCKMQGRVARLCLSLTMAAKMDTVALNGTLVPHQMHVMSLSRAWVSPGYSERVVDIKIKTMPLNQGLCVIPAINLTKTSSAMYSFHVACYTAVFLVARITYGMHATSRHSQARKCTATGKVMRRLSGRLIL